MILRLIAIFLASSVVCVFADDETVGYLEPGRTIKVSSAEPGVVQDVMVQEGQKVHKGDILVRLDTHVLEQEAKMATEEYALLSHRLDKLRELVPQKFASEDELSRAESDLKITDLRKQKIEAEIDLLTLRSPIDGVVTELRFDVAESVPGPNSHVATVVQLDPMRVQLNLPVAEASHLKVGQSVQLLFPDSGQTRTGNVEFISPVSTAVVNTVRVKISVPQPGNDLPAGAKVQLAPTSPEKSP